MEPNVLYEYEVDETSADNDEYMSKLKDCLLVDDMQKIKEPKMKLAANAAV
jgi:hypothetical protein